MASFTVPCSKPSTLAGFGSSAQKSWHMNHIKQNLSLNRRGFCLKDSFSFGSGIEGPNKKSTGLILHALNKVVEVKTSNSAPGLVSTLETAPSGGKVDPAVAISDQNSVPEESSVSTFISQVSDLIKLVDSRDIMELQLKQQDCEITIRKKEAIQPPAPAPSPYIALPPPQAYSTVAPPPTPTPTPAPAAAAPASAAAPKAGSSHPPLKCPMAGTFYRSPGPGEPPFVKVGDKVQKGEHRSCWDDISESIRQARRLIYITGWSVCHGVRLVRDGKHKECILGDLLKAKSQEGVRVLLLVWDDPTSRGMLGWKKVGMLHTNDEETRRFFKHSSVQVILCPRSGGKGHSWIRKPEAGAIYSHHQKTVIVDADAGHHKRKIVAFVGGLDLCVGRYDTPRHPLFKTLQTTHVDDFYNPNFAGPTTGCPRVPWHDLHSKIDGPAAYDVLANFEERWLRASEPHVLRRLKKLHEDVLLKIERIPEILGIDDATQLCNNDPEGWNVQIFRSIDSNSVKGFPDNPKDAISRNLVCGKNVMIDMSIHSAYVSAIRSAQRFIYIENQYFLGSSYNWSALKDVGANNLIPMEIALKIVEKIKANERFSVYVVIPMWPEGVPTGFQVQRILFWQSRTMQMMYEMIYRALEEVGLHKTYEPEDYLNFFCLGNREVVSDRDGVEAGNAEKIQSHVRKSRRFMIYVHSKGMIVDDEYVILGSANINQRSLEGTRDTEIAMGAYQPHHTWSSSKRSSPRGQVYGYRMSLWTEHTGTVEECLERPESIECVRRMRSLGEKNWRQYVAEEVTEMRSHLLKYPLQVDPTGNITHLPGSETFPDLGGKILGTFIPIQENLTI